jgi:hypothetical protein
MKLPKRIHEKERGSVLNLNAFIHFFIDFKKRKGQKPLSIIYIIND